MRELVPGNSCTGPRSTERELVARAEIPLIAAYRCVMEASIGRHSVQTIESHIF
jgi:hypothetical protein